MTSTSEAVLTQLRKGVLEYCVLACLSQGASYGLELTARLATAQLVSSEGTLYPLLSRLRKQGLVETTWQESTSGPPRRYYQLTEAGTTSLRAFAATWQPFSSAVNELMRETR